MYGCVYISISMAHMYDRELHTHFLNACCEGDLEFIKDLVSANFIDICNRDVLYYAAENGHLAVIKYLVSQGANIHACNENALRIASLHGYLDIVKYLIAKGANIHILCEAAAHNACRNGHLAIIKYLVARGANIYTLNRLQNDCFDEAFFNNEYEIQAYLVSQGADKSRLSLTASHYTAIWINNQESSRIQAQKRIYFWWIRRCFDMSAPSGIRMCLASLAAYKSLCAS